MEEEFVDNVSESLSSHSSLIPFCRWPGLVGMDIFRARAIVRYGTRYYVKVLPYKKSKDCPRPPVYDETTGELLPPDIRRVILWVDTNGYVAITPQTG